MRTTATIAIVLLAMAPNAQAQDRAAIEKRCEYFGMIAEAAMLQRQGGMDVITAIRELTEVAGEEDAELVEYAVTGAFRETRYMTKEMASRAVEDYKNEMILACWDLRPGQ